MHTKKHKMHARSLPRALEEGTMTHSEIWLELKKREAAEMKRIRAEDHVQRRPTERRRLPDLPEIKSDNPWDRAFGYIAAPKPADPEVEPDAADMDSRVADPVAMAKYLKLVREGRITGGEPRFFPAARDATFDRALRSARELPLEDAAGLKLASRGADNLPTPVLSERRAAMALARERLHLARHDVEARRFVPRGK